MTRAEQIRKALELLEPPAKERDACRQDIERALDSMARTAARTKADKLARDSKKLWQSHNRQLERLIIISNKLKAAGWRPPLDHLLARLTELEVKEAAEEADEAKFFSRFYPSINVFQPVDLQGTLTWSERWVRGYILPPPSAASLQKHAVTLAHALLERWRGSKAIKKTRGGPWWRLAAILLDKRTGELGEKGEAGADLFRHIRDFRPADDPQS
jgi:hypothetical protein